MISFFKYQHFASNSSKCQKDDLLSRIPSPWLTAGGVILICETGILLHI